MSYWTLLQVIFNLFVFAALVAMWWRLRRPPQDDPRLSRGLQLLQTKITVLEDLSDRTDAQVKQLTTLIDQKTRALQNKVIEAEQQIIKIDHSVSQSEASTLSAITVETQGDSLPHQELAERERTVAYVKAAKMANSGNSVEEIAQQVNLPREQLELIAKFNRDQLMFDEEQLPDWAQKDATHFNFGGIDFVGNLDKPTTDLAHLARIENNFKQAVHAVKKADEAAKQSILDTRVAESIKASMATGIASMANSYETVQPAVMAVKATAQTLKDKLVATAEDMLKNGQAHARVGDSTSEKAPGFEATLLGQPSQSTESGGHKKPMPESTNPTVNVGAAAYANAVFKPEAPKVRKVVFPRIEKLT